MTDKYASVESVSYDPDWAFDDEPPYITRTYGCGCCTYTNNVTAPEAREAALSLIERLKANIAEVEKFIADLDAREAGTNPAVG